MTSRHIPAQLPEPDPQVEEMLADPEGYFARARVAAAEEAPRFVRAEQHRRAARRSTPRPA